MKDSLFDIPDSPSPYQAFLVRHEISIKEIASDQFEAFPGDEESKAAKGTTAKDAVFALAQKLNLEGWKEINWA